MKNTNIRTLNRREAYIKRTAVVRREKLILSIIFIAAFLFSLLFFTNKTNAGNFKDDSNSVKMYKSITIYSGDTLESIAEEYMSDEYSSVNKYINEVLSINSMTLDTTLVAGNNIIVPYYMSKSISTDPVIEISLAK